MTQTIDFRFELFFLLSVLTCLILLTTALVLRARGRRPGSKRLLKIMAIGWAAYLLTVFVVSASTPQRIIPMHQDLCFDEMCFAAVNVQTRPNIRTQPANGVFYIVTVRVSNHARGRAQSERGLNARFYSRGHEYQISRAGQHAWEAEHPETVALTARIQAGQSVFSDQVFDIPAQRTDPGLVLSNGFTPGYFVIGECPLFHKPTILSLRR